MAMTAATETSAVSASSLRALALSTLKSKRRKPAAVQPTVPVLSRPLPPAPPLDGMQLDYGEDESSLVGGSRMDVDPPVIRDGLMREEGEISDEEGSSRRLPAKAATEPSPQEPPATSAKPLPAPGGLSLLDRITDPPQVLPSIAESSKPLSERISSPPTASTSSRSIHTQQVRPNVPMDQSKYDIAKDLFLELLGWGVDPEYLVEAGLTRELIYYAFTELNLRLPNNLDTTGLLPYNPETVKSFSFIEPDPSSPGSLKEPSPFGSNTVDIGKPSRGDQVAAGPAQGDLHNIEMLRRQELIARKAVQASRKAKKSNTNPVVAKVPSETVDDFLNSIVPAAEVVPQASQTPAPQLVESPSEHLTPSVSPPSPTFAEGKPNSTPPLEAPPSSTESVTVAFDNAMRLSPDTSSGDSTPTHQYPNRRGTKRPVASDFVDWDGSSRPLGRSNSYDVTPNPHHHHTRRKTGATSFVNVPMRCVIDLSDSETDEDDETATRPATSKVILTLPSNGVSVPDRSRPAPKSASSTGTTTPSTLEETEREIERMKQLIAERTRRQNLKKLAAAKAGASESAIPARESVTPVPSSAVDSASNSTSPTAPPSNSGPVLADVDDVGKTSAQLLQDQTMKEQDTKVEPMTSVDHDQELSPSNGSVDVDIAMSSSAQVPQVSAMPHAQEMSTQRHESSMPHDSFFASYPLLRLSLPTYLAGVPSSPKDSSRPSFPLPDLKPLREATLIKSIDPSKFLCQYEVPGGGVCRDANCEDVHLSRLDGELSSVEPNDQDTAKYLGSVCDGLSFDLILAALQQERSNKPKASLEELVARILVSQRSSLPEPPPAS